MTFVYDHERNLLIRKFTPPMSEWGDGVLIEEATHFAGPHEPDYTHPDYTDARPLFTVHGVTYRLERND